MPIPTANEALTLQTLFLLFNSKGSSSKCCSSVGLFDTSLSSGWLFSVFRRMVTCSTMFFLTRQSIRTTNRLERSSWTFLLFRSHQRARSSYHHHVIGVAPPTSPSDEEHHQTPMGFNPFWCVTCHTNEGAARTISIAILSWTSTAIDCSCFGIHLPQFYNHVLSL